MSISILTWNIEQFGATRSKYPNRVNRVCDLIHRDKPDIAVIIELKTTKPDVGIDIAEKLVRRLAWLDGAREYEYILTHHNGLEMYLYLYNTNRVDPCVIPAGVRKFYREAELANLELVPAPAQRTARLNATQLSHHFPLLNYPQRTARHRLLGAGFFRERTTSKYYAVVAWHNEAGFYKRTRAGAITNDSRPTKNLGKLAGSAMVTNGDIHVKVKPPGGAAQPVTVNNVVITGDFNVDYTTRHGKAAYDAFTNWWVAIGKHTYINKDVTTGDVRILGRCYDNFILSPAFRMNHRVNSRRWEFAKWFDDQGKRFLKAMINESDLLNADVLDDLAVDTVRSQFEQAVKKRKPFGYIYARQRDNVFDLIRSQSIRKWRRSGVRAQFQRALTEEFDGYENRDEIVETITLWLDDQRVEYDDTLRTYTYARSMPVTLTDVQKAKLVLSILSDHVPVYLTAAST